MEEWFPFVQSTNYPFPTLANHMTSKSNAMMYTVHSMKKEVHMKDHMLLFIYYLKQMKSRNVVI